MSRVVALTGNVAAGKSTVTALFRGWGAKIIDADTIVRELQQPGTPVLARIAARFGQDILTERGELNRAALRQLISLDSTAREDLDTIVHPAVLTRIDAQIRAAVAQGDAVIVVDIPLLFEADDPSRYDIVVVVDAPVTERHRRLVETRGLEPAEAMRLIAMQQPSEQKRALADYVIENDSDRATLERRARVVWDRIAT